VRRTLLAVVALSLLGAKAAVRAPIETLEWSADASRLVAAGKVGPVIVVDEKGKAKVVGESIGQPRLSPDGAWLTGTKDGAFVAIEVASGQSAPLEGIPNRGRPLRYVRTVGGDVVLLKDSAHHELHRLGDAVTDDAPLSLKNFVDVWPDPADPLLYVDTGYGLAIHHLWTGGLLRTYDSGRRDQRYLDAVRDRDGRVVLLLADEDGVRVWSPPDPPSSRLEVPEGGVVGLSADGSWVVLGGPDGVEVRASVNQEPLVTFRTKGRVVALDVSPDGARLAAGLEDGSVKVFDTSRVSAPSPTDRAVTDVDSGRLRPEVLRAPPPPRKVPPRSLAMPGSTVALTWSPTGRVSGWVGTRFVELDPTGKTFDPAVPLVPGKPFAYTPDGSVLAGITPTGVALVDTRYSKRWKVTREIPTGGGHQQLQWNRDVLVVDAGSGKARAWDPLSSQPLGEVYATSVDATARFVQSPDGSRLAITGRMPGLLDARTGARRSDLSGHVGGVMAAAWSPDGSRLATAGADGSVLIWDTASMQPAVLVDGAHGTRLAFSPDGARLLSGSSEGGVVIDATTGARLEHLTFQGQLEAVSWSAAGRMMADNAGTVLFWDP
jgi:WD40 repeat protein